MIPSLSSAAGTLPGTPHPEAAIEARLVSVSFGGVVALDQVNLRVGQGELHGLIGPNGAGKTTLFNVLTGFQRPTAGHVQLDGVDVSRFGPARRARMGLGRTFQRIELFEGLTVRRNVELGYEAALAGSNPLRHVVASADDRRAVTTATEEALRLTGLSTVSQRSAGSLPSGMRRLLEVARLLAGRFRVLLLDEPSSGLDPAESERLGEVLRRVMAERHLSMVLVEHHMAMVMALCDKVHVLDFGRLIFDGTPQEVLQSAEVRKAYLGSSL